MHQPIKVIFVQDCWVFAFFLQLGVKKLNLLILIREFAECTGNLNPTPKNDACQKDIMKQVHTHEPLTLGAAVKIQSPERTGPRDICTPAFWCYILL
jgi:hypothetical protein